MADEDRRGTNHTGPESTRERNLETAIDSYAHKREAREDARLAGESKSGRARSGIEKLMTRTLYGALYAVIVLACLWFGKIPTAALFAAMAWLCCSEFFRIARMMGRMPNEVIGLAAAVVFPILPLLPDAWTPFWLSLLVLAAGVWYVWTLPASIGDVALTVFGPVYTGYLMSSVVMIRMLEPPVPGTSLGSFLLVFGVIASIWMSDAAAYFVGSRFGRHKMVPKISPNKTWEGFAGGLVGSVFVWLLMAVLQVPGVNLWLAIVGGLCVGIASVIGDLFESRLKRAAGVKDSGNFIPGHGGMLDRSDSILFGCMTAYLILKLGGFS